MKHMFRWIVDALLVDKKNNITHLQMGVFLNESKLTLNYLKKSLTWLVNFWNSSY